MQKFALAFCTPLGVSMLILKKSFMSRNFLNDSLMSIIFTHSTIFFICKYGFLYSTYSWILSIDSDISYFNIFFPKFLQCS